MECKIRPLTMKDASDITNILNNKKIVDNKHHNNGSPPPYTIEEAMAFIEETLNSESPETYSYAITLDDIAIGIIGIFRQDNIRHRTAKIEYYITEDCWGKDIVTSAVIQTCELIFNNTDILRIFSEPIADNHASCKVLENAGFTLEGILRKNVIKNGEIKDMKLYALIKE